jgi:hypothetical protein
MMNSPYIRAHIERGKRIRAERQRKEQRQPGRSRNDLRAESIEKWEAKWQELIERGVVWSDEEWARRNRERRAETNARVFGRTEDGEAI